MTNVRADIPAKYKWDMTNIYATEQDFEADYQKAADMVAAFPAHAATMGQSAEGLLAMFTDFTSMLRVVEKLYMYAHLSADADTTDNHYQAMMGKMRNLFNKLGSASFFVTPALIRLDSDTVEKWMEECPALRAFSRDIWLAQREKPHTLSDECEKLMADMASGMGGASNVRAIFANADLQFGKIRDESGKPVQLNDATYVSKLMSSERRVRRAAFTTLYKTYTQYGNTFATLYNAYVKERTTMARVRGYADSLTASVFRDEVTPEIYNNLINTVNENLGVLFDYYAVKKQVLGLSKLHLYDIYTPLIAECEKEYSFEEATEEVLGTVKIFGSEYHDTLEKGIKEQNWVDVYPSRGKRGGAYSSGCYDTQPYMLLNFVGTLDNVSTFAHESGHSMHSYFSRKYNEPQNSSYTIFVAEVASTVNELLFCHRKLRESDSREEKLAILNQIMETYKGTLYRQTMFAEFERDVHAMVEGGATLTKDLLCKTYYDIVCKYFGPGVVCDKEIANEWMRIPHFYTNFYVYKYATCISAASSIVRRIETEGEAYIGQYLDFLKCGGSKSPLDSLLVAGIDMRDPAVIKTAIDDFADTIAQFKELY
ncbi:MAG: oligoendopeptidase F [Clostridia bacterium]|nr:oligoendopeptidase F [Clostridia bacterium]